MGENDRRVLEQIYICFEYMHHEGRIMATKYMAAYETKLCEKRHISQFLLERRHVLKVYNPAYSLWS
jgi:hypothetical protein